MGTLSSFSIIPLYFKGYDDRRPHRDRSWEGRSGSMDRERYMHPHKEWDNDDYRPGEWGRERHWQMHDAQVIIFRFMYHYLHLNNSTDLFSNKILITIFF